MLLVNASKNRTEQKSSSSVTATLADSRHTGEMFRSAFVLLNYDQDANPFLHQRGSSKAKFRNMTWMVSLLNPSSLNLTRTST